MGVFNIFIYLKKIKILKKLHKYTNNLYII